MLQKLTAAILLLITSQVSGQDCSFTLSGRIIDNHDQSPLSFATVYIVDNSRGVTADSLGNFSISGLCPGNYTIIIEHLGCTPDTQSIPLTRSLTRNFYLEHHADELAEVVALSTREKRLSSESSVSIQGDDLEALKGKDLGAIVKSLSGVRLLSTGSSISKPVIHGLYGDRINIISAGTQLEAQDWGTEHAPEVDPYSAQEVRVAKGAASLEFNTQAIGGVILLEPAPLSLNAHVKAGLTYTGQSNGWSQGISAYTEQGIRNKFAYRLSGTYKRAGDLHAPGYVMSNTGQQQGDLGFMSKWMIGDWDFKANYSLYSQQPGILSASHIGNITDLQNALQSDRPLIIRDAGFDIINPKQQVRHQVADLRITKDLHQAGYIDLKTTFQNNKRREYDIRRGGRSDIPALNMRLNTFDFRPAYHFEKTYTKGWHYQQHSGINYQYKYNFNDPETGIVPLIPDYQNHMIGLYSIHEIDKESVLFEAGLRYEWNRFEAYTFNQNKVVDRQYEFHSYAASLGAKWMQDFIDVSANLAFTQRNPNASELFSRGLHHGLAVLEFGDASLDPERSINFTTQIDLKYKEYLSLSLSAYVNPIRDFIYLEPDSALVLTIRGAFPAFHYRQTRALLYGFDLDVQSNPFKWWELGLRSSIVRGRNMTTHEWLIYMPADQVAASTEFSFDHKKWKHIFFKTTAEYNFFQSRTPASIPDLKVAPDAYFLLQFSAGTRYAFTPKHLLGFSLNVENALNTTYRDYLNRFRYYTDEMGMNIVLRLNYTFG